MLRGLPALVRRERQRRKEARGNNEASRATMPWLALALIAIGIGLAALAAMVG